MYGLLFVKLWINQSPKIIGCLGVYVKRIGLFDSGEGVEIKNESISPMLVAPLLSLPQRANLLCSVYFMGDLESFS